MTNIVPLPSCLESNWGTRGQCILKCNPVCMQMCLRRLTFQNQRALINSEGVRSNLGQSLLLIKISQSRSLSETRPRNSICVHICSYQTLHLCWIYVPACRCVLSPCCCVDIHRCRHLWLLLWCRRRAALGERVSKPHLEDRLTLRRYSSDI